MFEHKIPADVLRDETGKIAGFTYIPCTVELLQDGERLRFTRGERARSVKIIPDLEYLFKIQKTQIRAIDGAPGLYRFLENDARNGGCYASAIINAAFDKMKIREV